MKRTLLSLGSLLTLSLILVLFWVSFGMRIFAIQEVSCTLLEKACTAEVSESIESYLNQQHFFVTDFSSLEKETGYSVVSFSKQIPGKIDLEIKPAAFALETKQLVQIDDNAVDAVAASLSNAQIEYQAIEKVESAQVLVVQLANDRQAILRLTHLEVDTEKLLLVLSNIDFNQVDVAIREVDVRYRLPVLRTETTSFN